jgi:hypothetical protein
MTALQPAAALSGAAEGLKHSAAPSAEGTMSLHESTLGCTEERRLSPKQESAAVSLGNGCTIARAARHCGASLRTVKLWLATVPDFKQRVNQLRSEMTSQAIGQLAELLATANSAFRRLLEAPDTPPRILLETGRTVFETYIGLTNQSDLQEQIDRLKASLERK